MSAVTRASNLEYVFRRRLGHPVFGGGDDAWALLFLRSQDGLLRLGKIPSRTSNAGVLCSRALKVRQTARVLAVKSERNCTIRSSLAAEGAAGTKRTQSRRTIQFRGGGLCGRSRVTLNSKQDRPVIGQVTVFRHADWSEPTSIRQPQAPGSDIPWGQHCMTYRAGPGPGRE